MSNKSSLIKIKNSSVPDKVPQVSDLAFGELAINFNDGKLYFKNSANEIDFFAADATVASVVSDDTLIGTGTESDPLGVSFPVFNVVDRENNALIELSMTPFLISVFKYDAFRRDFPNVSVYDREDTDFSVLITG